MLLANFNGKEHLRHRAVSLRQHGFLVLTYTYYLTKNNCQYYYKREHTTRTSYRQSQILD